MSNHIFKYVNGKFVITEGYGSVRKKVNEETPDWDEAYAAAGEETPKAKKEKQAQQAAADEKTAEKTQSSSTAQPQYKEPEADPNFDTDAGYGAAPKNKPASATFGGELEDEENQDLTSLAGFAKAIGQGNQAAVTNFADKIIAWAKSRGIEFDSTKLKAGSDKLDMTPPAPGEPMQVVESQYFSPRIKKSFIRHPSLLPYGYGK